MPTPDVTKFPSGIPEISSFYGPGRQPMAQQDEKIVVGGKDASALHLTIVCCRLLHTKIPEVVL